MLPAAFGLAPGAEAVVHFGRRGLRRVAADYGLINDLIID